MAFETFTGKRVVTKEPRVTLLKQGNFNFNTGSMKILKEQEATHLQMLFDRETNRIAFKPCSKETEGAYTLRDANGIGAVSGGSFLKFCGLSVPQETRSYPAQWEPEQGMLIISLN